MKKIKTFNTYPDTTLKFYVDFSTMELKCNCPDDFSDLYEISTVGGNLKIKQTDRKDE